MLARNALAVSKFSATRMVLKDRAAFVAQLRQISTTVAKRDIDSAAKYTKSVFEL
jgi:hypothetical protein